MKDRESISQRWELEDLLEQSSIGVGLRDIEERGIDAHLKDLEQEMQPRWKRRTS